MKFSAWILGVAATVGASTYAPTAAADATVAPTTEAMTTRWYGWQTLLGDVPALASYAVGAATDNRSAQDVLLPTSVGLYLAVSPVIHLCHRRVGVAAADLGLRVSAPLVGGGIGLAVGTLAVPDRCGGVDCLYVGDSMFIGMAWGAGAGVAIAVAIDSLLLAREKVAVPNASRRGVMVTPLLKRIDGGATVGIAGLF